MLQENRPSGRTVLLVAAGRLQLPLFFEARACGLRVVAVDRNPSAPGMKLADKAFPVDIVDMAGVERVAIGEKVSAVSSICTDFAVRTVAHVATRLNLPGPYPCAAEAATDKRLMRRALLEAGLPCPRYRVISRLNDAIESGRQIGYPLVLKIPRAAGSRGVFIIESEDLMQACFAKARALEPAIDLLVESYIAGPEVSVEGCCIGAEPHIVQITDKLLFPGESPVEAGHTQPSALSGGDTAAIREVAIEGIRALGLSDCGFHAELKVGPTGPVVIEIAARLGGDRIASHLTPLSTGVNIVRAALDVSMGLTPDLRHTKKHAAAIRYFAVDEPSIVQDVSGLSRIPREAGFELLSAETERGTPLTAGLRVSPPASSHDRSGHVLFSGQTSQEASQRAEAALKALKFQPVATSCAMG